ncbi:hypothetical protein FFL34_06775 [Lentibacillus cibarius]|uniref:Uncharacterized protein n=2 Tax=Lentibacillus cibarius TaxID=2583219 RepID=A0A5S3QRD6_9BACI|nr:hypothetical protein FFL34_06775 [Lentibacillus cibarius]
MREKERINRIMLLLQKIWKQQPDVRFNQLISNLQQMYSAEHNGYGRKKIKEIDLFDKEIETAYLDFFFLEDDKWEEFLQAIVDKQQNDNSGSNG